MKPDFSPTIFDASISSIKVREVLLDGIKDSILFMANPSIEEWKIMSLPMFLSSFYYVLRPIRLINKYKFGLLKFKTNSNLFHSHK